jgi:L-threonylcarbamoyladenylate synthase
VGNGTGDVEGAVAALERGGLVAFPTETVYGLGADARRPGALRRLYAVKRRPASHPVIVHLPAGHDVDELLAPWAAAVPSAARVLADACWPGPLTVLLGRAPGVPDEVTGGHDTVGVRVPDQPLAQRLLAGFGGGIAAPSANRFGRVSPTTAEHVRADLGDDVDVILDGGPCRVGVESTIVDCTGDLPVVARLGALSREHLEAVLGCPLPVRVDGTIAAPGTLPSHYAPTARVELVTAHELVPRAEALVAAGTRVGVLAPPPLPVLPVEVERLDTPGPVDQLAHELYTLLRDADRRGVDVLLAVPPTRCGLGAAVADRLTRAAREPVAESGR